MIAVYFGLMAFNFNIKNKGIPVLNYYKIFTNTIRIQNVIQQIIY